MRDSFSSFHPIINFIYFASVITFTMFFMHPVFLIIGLTSSLIFLWMLKGIKTVGRNIILMVPVLLLITLINTLFNNQGATILFYLKNGNPITLESIIYGFGTGSMLISVILWFSCYNVEMTSDKFIYLFGKAIPSLSLIFSMVLRFVPRFTHQIKVIINAQNCIGQGLSQGKTIHKIKNGMKILSIMTTWALENSIETSNSMKSRGYGLPNRSNFSMFRFDNRDRIVLVLLTILILIILIGAYLGINTMVFFPKIKMVSFTPTSLLVYTAHLFLCMLPVFINILEDFKWKYTISRI